MSWTWRLKVLVGQICHSRKEGHFLQFAVIHTCDHLELNLDVQRIYENSNIEWELDLEKENGGNLQERVRIYLWGRVRTEAKFLVVTHLGEDSGSSNKALM